MSVRTFPQPESMRCGITGTCKWCGEPTVKKPALYWHPECADEYLLHTRPDRQLAFLIERDGLKCSCCPHGVEPWRPAGKPYPLLWQPWMREDRKGQWAHLWAMPKWQDRLEDDWRQLGLYQRIERSHNLQVDHKTPLWSVADLPNDERRPYFGPGNLWLLCEVCHKAKTAREAKERAGIRAFAKAQLALPI